VAGDHGRSVVIFFAALTVGGLEQVKVPNITQFRRRFGDATVDAVLTPLVNRKHRA
jgi:hypothetical protein